MIAVSEPSLFKLYASDSFVQPPARGKHECSQKSRIN
uniref:Uncharacterized protein n=1 Tax=Anguilla anguilla TaxID=7936 RepID=A0A0E9U914_ANGAN